MKYIRYDTQHKSPYTVTVTALLDKIIQGCYSNHLDHLHSGVHLNPALEHYNFFCTLSHKCTGSTSISQISP